MLVGKKEGRGERGYVTHPLELVLHQLAMVLNQHLLALAHQPLPRTRMKVKVHAVLLLAQPRLRLLHVLRDAVLGEILFALGLVVRFGGREEGLLECVAVDFEVLTVRVGFVETESDCERRRGQWEEGEERERRDGQRTERVDNLLDEIRLNRLAVTLLLDKLQHRMSKLALGLDVVVEVVLPRDEGELCER